MGDTIRTIAEVHGSGVMHLVKMQKCLLLITSFPKTWNAAKSIQVREGKAV